MRITDFYVNYGNIEIIESLNFEVGFPSVVAIIGNNGSGKSTFFNALRQKIAFKGDFQFQGKSLQSTRFSFLGVRNIFNFSFPTKDFIRINSDIDKGEECFNLLVEWLEIDALLDKNIETLSEGQLQKCLIAQTLMQYSDVVLLDEPESHLDIKSRNMLTKTLRAYSNKYQKVIFIVSHDLQMVEKVADLVVNFSRKPLELDKVTNAVIEAHQDYLANQPTKRNFN